MRSAPHIFSNTLFRKVYFLSASTFAFTRVNGVEIFYDEFENYIKSLYDPNTSQNEGLIEKNRILKTIVDEAQNNQNAKGDDCP